MNSTGQTLNLTDSKTPSSHWHQAPPQQLGDGEKAQVKAGSNSMQGTHVQFSYELQDGSVTFSGFAAIPPSWAKNWASTNESPDTNAYRTESHVEHGVTINVDGDWQFIKN